MEPSRLAPLVLWLVERGDDTDTIAEQIEFGDHYPLPVEQLYSAKQPPSQVRQPFASRSCLDRQDRSFSPWWRCVHSFIVHCWNAIVAHCRHESKEGRCGA